MAENKPSKTDNVYVRLNRARTMFHSREIKKSGRNKFSNYDYFELEDIVPNKIEIFEQVGLCDFITFNNEEASLLLINVDAPDDNIVFTLPMRDLEIKGANAIQALGGTETYLRRYLYQLVLDIVERDAFDTTTTDAPQEGGKSGAPVMPSSSPSFAEELSAMIETMSTDEKKKAAEIIKKHNNGKAAYREIKNPEIQKAILAEYKEVFKHA